jgi:hypothetical protein
MFHSRSAPSALFTPFGVCSGRWLLPHDAMAAARVYSTDRPQLLRMDDGTWQRLLVYLMMRPLPDGRTLCYAGQAPRAGLKRRGPYPEEMLNRDGFDWFFGGPPCPGFSLSVPDVAHGEAFLRLVVSCAGPAVVAANNAPTPCESLTEHETRLRERLLAALSVALRGEPAGALLMSTAWDWHWQLAGAARPATPRPVLDMLNLLAMRKVAAGERLRGEPAAGVTVEAVVQPDGWLRSGGQVFASPTAVVMHALDRVRANGRPVGARTRRSGTAVLKVVEKRPGSPAYPSLHELGLRECQARDGQRTR